jgi:hypothetical protein
MPFPAPLLTFPPSSLPSLSPATITFPLPPSPFTRALSLSPLLFISTLLLFSLYAYLTLLSHLILLEGEWIRGALEGVMYLWLWSGCTGSLIMCYIRGGGRVQGVQRGRGRGEERDVETGRMEGPSEEEEGEGGKEDEPLMRGESGSVQVKSDGRARFCRKVSTRLEGRGGD